MKTIEVNTMAEAIIVGLRERGDFGIEKENIADAFATIAELQGKLDEQEAWTARIGQLTRTLANYNELVNQLAKKD